MFSTCAAFVTSLEDSLESELGRVFHLCNICDRFVGYWQQGAFLQALFVWLGLVVLGELRDGSFRAVRNSGSSLVIRSRISL